MTMEREEGWYWVKWFVTSYWQVAELYNGVFENAACNLDEEDVYKIGPRIEEPEDE